MNLKIELFKAFAFILVGAFLWARFQPKNKPQEVAQVQQQQQECKVIVKKVTRPDGTVDEVTEFLAKNQQKQEQKIEPKKNVYGLGLKREYDFKNQKDLYELEIMRDTGLGFDIVFSYNSGNQAGIGIIKRF